MLTCSHPIFPSPSLPLHLLRTTSQRPQGWHLREPHLTVEVRWIFIKPYSKFTWMKEDETGWNKEKWHPADIAKVCERLNTTLFAAELNSVQPEIRGGFNAKLCRATYAGSEDPGSGQIAGQIAGEPSVGEMMWNILKHFETWLM